MRKQWIAFLESGGSQEVGELTQEVLGMDLKDEKYYKEVAQLLTTYLDELEGINK